MKTRLVMLRNYFITALRHTAKNKGFSFLNLAGLALGMSCAILILLWVQDEISYNHFHKKYDHIFQVLENQTYADKTYTFAATPGLLSGAMKTELPAVKNATRSDWGNKWLFSLDDKAIYEEGLRVDSTFLDIFSFPLLKGNPKQALTGIYSLVISEKMAKKFFGNANPIGKTLKVNNKEDFTITGVIKDVPENSTIKFEWLASFVLFEREVSWWNNWGTNGLQTFVELEPNVDVKAFNKTFKNFIVSKKSDVSARPFLFPMSDWRLYNKFEEGVQTGGRIEYVRLFSIIAAIIIFIACINFMNLATARSEQRAREVGVRKVLGASKGTLIGQFLGESLILSFGAIVLACLIVWLTLPSFNELIEKKLSLNLTHTELLIGLGSILLICAILAGSYPSFYLSSFKPVTIFRGLRMGKSGAAILLRKGLVITQFMASIVLIISTIIIYQQIQHVKNRNLGYDKENLVCLDLQGNMREKFSVIRNDLLASGAVVEAATGSSSPLEIGSSSGNYEWEGKDPTKEVLISMSGVTPQYFATAGIQLKEGRTFYDSPTQDTNSVIINETFAKIIGKKDPIGTILHSDDRNLEVIGVVKDFIFNDMYKEPDPAIFYKDPEWASTLFIRLKSHQDISKALAKVETVLKNDAPGYPFDYQFLDASFRERFKSEMLIGNLSKIFAAFAIFISCLGLFGLAAFTAEQRTKEIGIRKVLGATVSDIVSLLSKDFLLLVLIAAVIAFPLAWYFMHHWLQDFAYRIGIEWWVFVAAGAVALLIALFTVSFQAVRAALANPADSLKTE